MARLFPRLFHFPEYLLLLLLPAPTLRYLASIVFFLSFPVQDDWTAGRIWPIRSIGHALALAMASDFGNSDPLFLS